MTTRGSQTTGCVSCGPSPAAGFGGGAPANDSRRLPGRGKGLAAGLEHRLRYISRMSGEGEGANGYGWVSETIPNLWYSPVTTDGHPDEVIMVKGRRRSTWFVWFEAAYQGQYGTRLTLEVSGEDYVVRGPRGKRWVFYGPDAGGGLRGSPKSWTNAGGQVTEVSYDGSALVALERSDAAGENKAGLYFSYSGSGPHAGKLLQVEKRLDRGGALTPLLRTVYAYHSGDDAAGSLNDLKSIEVLEYAADAGQWLRLRKSYYRYYKTDGGGGFVHGLKYEVDPEAYARMGAAGLSPEDVSAVPDSMLEQYATKMFVYDAQHRVTETRLNAGAEENAFERLDSDHAEGRNWWRRTIRTRGDGAEIVTYANRINQPVLRILRKGTDSWAEYFEYNDQYRWLLHAGPDAIASVTEPTGASQNLSVTLSTNAGLVRKREYYPQTGGGTGSAPGRLKAETLQQGSAGTPVKLRELTYASHDTGEQTIYELASETVYRSDSGGGSQPATTSHSYVWETGGARKIQETVQPPVVPVGENGTGQTYSVVDRFDMFGNLVWRKDEAAILAFQAYEVLTGALRQRILDVDTTRMDPTDVPSGWSTASGAGLHLVNDYESDGRGRTLVALGPPHTVDLDGRAQEVRRADYTVYLDSRRQTHRARGYLQFDAWRTLGPVRIEQRDLKGNLTDAVEAPHPEEGRIDSADRYPQGTWTRWKHSIYDDHDRLVEDRAYFDIPASDREVDGNPSEGFEGEHYAETRYDYDAIGRRIGLNAGCGTITRTVYDPRGLVLEEWVGTNDAGATPGDPSGGGADPDNNMVHVLANQYDGGLSGGPGYLTKETRPADATPTNNQVVDHEYDFRGRRVRSTTADGTTTLLTTFAYDNLDRRTSLTGYHTSESPANRVAYQTTAFDSLGRIYKEETYGVDPATGNLGYPLVRQSWFDPVGNTIKRVEPGTQVYTKRHFDGVGREFANYLAYPQTGDLSGNSNNVSQDIVIEQNETVWDPARNAIFQTWCQRLDDASGVGPLLGPNGTQPRARVSYRAFWPDAIGRKGVSAEYGTNGGRVLERPAVAPEPSDTVLVRKTRYAVSGEPVETVSPKGIVTRSEFDRLGRRIKLIENYRLDAGSSEYDANRATEYHYGLCGHLKKLILRNPVTGDQVTRWVYGTSLEQSGVARNDLARAKIYPESDDVEKPLGDGPDGIRERVDYAYDRQGRVTQMIDPNGTEHAYAYDKSGRLLHDRAVALADGIDNAVRRISLSYNVRGHVAKVTSYDNPAVGSGSVVNEVAYAYDAFNNLAEDAQSHSGAVTGGTPKAVYAYADGCQNTARRTQMTYPGGAVLLYGYGTTGGIDDRLSRLASIAKQGELDAMAQYVWAGAGLPVRKTYPEPAVALTYRALEGEPLGDAGDVYTGYDRFGRIVDMRWRNTTNEEDLDRIQYGYDRDSLRLWRQNLAAPPTAGQDNAFGYDGLSQVVRDARGALNINRTAIGAIPAEDESFAYDPAGNWMSYRRDEDGEATLDQTRTHNRDNELVQIDGSAAGLAFDRAGNATQVRPAVGSDWNDGYDLTWDAWNRIVKVEKQSDSSLVAEYSYDGTYRRTTSTVGGQVRHFYYDDRWRRIEERLGVSTQPDHLHLWGAMASTRNDLARRDRDTDADGTLDERLYCLADAIDPSSIIDSMGAVRERYGFSTFGIAKIMDSEFGLRTSSMFQWRLLFHTEFRDSETGWDNYGQRYFVPNLGRWLSRDPLGEATGVSLYDFLRNNTPQYRDFLGLCRCDCKGEETAMETARDLAEDADKMKEAKEDKYYTAKWSVMDALFDFGIASAAAALACATGFVPACIAAGLVAAYYALRLKTAEHHLEQAGQEYSDAIMESEMHHTAQQEMEDIYQDCVNDLCPNSSYTPVQ